MKDPGVFRLKEEYEKLKSEIVLYNNKISKYEMYLSVFTIMFILSLLSTILGFVLKTILVQILGILTSAGFALAIFLVIRKQNSLHTAIQNNRDEMEKLVRKINFRARFYKAKEKRNGSNRKI